MLRIGLTGGIGAGKSTVSRRLVELGATLVDADLIARAVVAPGSQGLARVVAEFGPHVVAPDGGLDRPGLARIVFTDPTARGLLNSIVHPLVGRRTEELIAEAPPDAVLVQDIPLLVEGSMAPSFPLVVVVDAALEERVRRLVRSRGMPEKDARARIAAQADEAARRAAADVWLDNSGDRERLLTEVDRLWRDRLVPFEAAVRLGRIPAPMRPRLVKSDPSWPDHFRRLAERIGRAAGAVEGDVRHIGSTSVPGLAARDVLDVQLSVQGRSGADSLAARLRDVGFLPRPEVGSFGSADPGRPLDLYVRAIGSAEWRYDLLVRDWLRADPTARAEYLSVKRRASADADSATYDGAKEIWFASASDSAERWVRSTGWTTPVPRRLAATRTN
jgi:dephospho-CoA kinase